MLGQLYDKALDGESCWVRHDDGQLRHLPVRSWLGGRHADSQFDTAVVNLCVGPTIDLGCGPGRLVADLVRRGIPALGVDQSATAVGLARRIGAPVLRRDLFASLPGAGRWQTVLLADGNVGIGGEPRRVLRRASELLGRGGQCVVEFEKSISGIRTGLVRLESSQSVGPWFQWASVGIDTASRLADETGFTLAQVHSIGERVVGVLAVR
ncbi:class I SAM-dependent methyltransferase [Mycobacterium crocinum]|uniref:Class I SAM-dependent methyltransferase n=1 Tax=Mycolicibacterium crocinum TaxID=388459 RepID=A0ABY3TSV3_9MYCO|nr:class I SAM-dependent methyltransferase [Mycolicibacterium crocinum]MCV7217513.1 class I SAM-dependent methyltransferase [Mycolicibacterium crocinum]ULN42393.1 class I SAM-dependent methyltransferase [Mycolicibacterium crocinum]